MEQKNLLIAVVLTVAILLGWQFLYETPKMRAHQAAQQQAAEQMAKQGQISPDPQAAQNAAAPGQTTIPAEQSAPQTVDRAAALAQSPRVTIDSPRLKGSISLKGGRLDDLTLKDYRETVDKTSPNVVLLSPLGTKEAYYADSGWTSADPKVAVPGADTLWQADSDSLAAGQTVTLSWDNGQGLIFRRAFTVDDNYMFTVTQSVENKTGADVKLRPYARVKRFGTPAHPSQSYVLHEGMIGNFNGTLADPSYAKVRDRAQEPEKLFTYASTGGWAGITDKYWLVAQIADNQEAVTGEYFYEPKTDSYQADYVGTERSVAPGATVDTTQKLFAGAKEVNLLRDYRDNQQIANFDLAIDFGWYWFFTKPLMLLLYWLHHHVGNFGIAILILTVMVKALMFPLANKSYKSMSRMKQLTPQIQAMREKYGDDKMKLNQEMTALYKREKVNPAAGCLPVFVQIPVFFSLYKVFYVSMEMRQAPFFGWIKDLSAPDPTSWMNLFGLLPWDPSHWVTLPVVGGLIHVLSIGVWPLIMGFTMWLQQRLNPTPPDPVQAKLFTAMPIIFTFMLGSMPAGLVIYWAWNNTLSILQQRFIMWRMGVKA
ncbi:membrane protein insertase YidC [Dongia soli]|uniref:Membrane protein insertase YidC n=1 Tax=Dongia soli TaxID=600628 RepID=A0ABU5E5X8_9PROT|nr:membrane protein insertase YidC [Dongia soli]MDY0881656.1 membrane protein insertase YidC [Dongia soli]